DALIVRSTIDLAHNLDLQVVAEGVETKEVFEMLRILGCDMAQGYFIERPVPAKKLMQWYHSYQPDNILKIKAH
ncbi:MAG: EAL domain-containing protein, partial [Gammaproteobacteria bacterium]|nr:EAL domain-containing protein [Gammaproteobacteria bacterium]